MFIPVFEVVATREIACPLCGGTHVVENKHWWDEGKKVSEREAVEMAHHMEAYTTKALTTPFQLFEPRPTKAPAVKRARRAR